MTSRDGWAESNGRGRGGPGLSVRNLDIRYQSQPLLTGVHLDVGPDEIVALLGPSGSGKSSLLRCIAGVQRPESGSIEWDGVDIVTLPAHRRGIGLVFQDPLLFPHLDVAGNIAYGITRMPGRDERVADLLALVGLTGFEGRRITTLSGGEAQRVALARALAPRPRLLLLDEPFGALDRDLRDRLAVDVRALLRRVGTPALHVAHDRDEAAAIADRVVTLSSLSGGFPGP